MGRGGGADRFIKRGDLGQRQEDGLQGADDLGGRLERQGLDQQDGLLHLRQPGKRFHKRGQQAGRPQLAAAAGDPTHNACRQHYGSARIYPVVLAP